MSIKADLEQGLKDAMKSHDEDRKRVFRMALSSIKFIEKNENKELDDQELTAILQKEIKIRNETMQEALKSDREEMVSLLKNEIVILEGFLPKQLSVDDLQEIVKSAILEAQAKNAADMGKVMKIVLPKVKGRAANDTVSKLVKDLLASND